MIAVFSARCTSNEAGLIKGKRYEVTEVNGNFIKLEGLESNYDISMFEIEKAYFAFGKVLPEVSKPLTNIVRFTGNAWEKILETSLVEEIALLNEHTFLIKTNHSLYVYQLPGKINLIPLKSELLPTYLAVCKKRPESNSIDAFMTLGSDNAWVAHEAIGNVDAIAMLSEKHYLVITKNAQYMLFVKE